MIIGRSLVLRGELQKIFRKCQQSQKLMNYIDRAENEVLLREKQFNLLISHGINPNINPHLYLVMKQNPDQGCFG